MVSGHWGHRGLHLCPKLMMVPGPELRWPTSNLAAQAVSFTSSLCSTIAWLRPSGVGQVRRGRQYGEPDSLALRNATSLQNGHLPILYMIPTALESLRDGRVPSDIPGEDQ